MPGKYLNCTDKPGDKNHGWWIDYDGVSVGDFRAEVQDLKTKYMDKMEDHVPVFVKTGNSESLRSICHSLRLWAESAKSFGSTAGLGINNQAQALKNLCHWAAHAPNDKKLGEETIIDQAHLDSTISALTTLVEIMEAKLAQLNGRE